MSNNLTLVSTPYEGAKSQNIKIVPFFDEKQDNLGLQNYGLTLFDGVFHEEQLALIERNGVKRFLTGLNEFAPEVKTLPAELRDAKIKEIRNTVAQLEKDLASNMIDPNDVDFWNKVTLLKPDNTEFWSQLALRCGNEPVYLDPVKDPFDLIKIFAIEAGGFSIVARSLEEARARAVSPKFYLDKYVDTVSTKTEITKLRNKALSELTKLHDKNQNKLQLVAKVLDGNSVQYKKTTPNDITYENMDNYINGRGVESSTKRSAQSFLEVCALDMETLKLRAMIKDATFYRFLATKSDGFIYFLDTNSLMGRNPSDCLEYLKNPLHEQVLMDLTKKLEKYWI